MSRIFKLALFVLLPTVLLFSCKATKSIGEGEVDASLTTKKIIANHYKNDINFETLRGRVKIDYSDGKSNQGFNVSLRMKRDEVIWISAPLGIVKAKITPERVSFYNKLENEYFDGDFSFLSDLLGTELNFEKVQNLLLGNAVLDLRKQKYTSSIVKGNYGLKPKKENELYKILFFLEPKNFKVASQELSQPWEDRFLKIQYAYQEIDKEILPNTIAIEAIGNDDKSTIDLEYRNVEFNRPLNFPYKIPKGFEEIVLK